MNRLFGATAAAIAILWGSSLTTNSRAAETTGPRDVVDTAIAAKDFKTLVTAVKAADLVEALKGKGPFTVFAPTDKAFAKIPKADLESLLKDKKKLQAVLKYHVVPGKVMAADVVKLKSAKTVQGEAVKITVDKDKIKIDGANVLKADVPCSNGVIHFIDAVLLPPAK
jgi:uncharacterized surface protein with fasciclin (FAS1) repeats